MNGSADLVFYGRNTGEIFQALTPELEDELMRSRVNMTLCIGSIRLNIEGDEVVSLRAALNTWLRLVKVAFEMASIKKW